MKKKRQERRGIVAEKRKERKKDPTFRVMQITEKEKV